VLQCLLCLRFSFSFLFLFSFFFAVSNKYRMVILGFVVVLTANVYCSFTLRILADKGLKESLLEMVNTASGEFV